MTERSMRLVHRQGLEWSELDAEVVVLDRVLGELMRLDRVGGFIWRHLDGSCTADEIAARVVEQFDTDRRTATRDVDEFLGRLMSLDLVEARR
jgi:hypothetical protein